MERFAVSAKEWGPMAQKKCLLRGFNLLVACWALWIATRDNFLYLAFEADDALNG